MALQCRNHRRAQRKFRIRGQSEPRCKAPRFASSPPLPRHVPNHVSPASTRLLHRSTWRVGLSEAGQELLQRITPSLKELDTAMDALRQHGNRPAGLLRLTVPNVAVTTLLDPLLGELMARWPDVKLDIHVDNGLNDLIAEGFDAGIRLRNGCSATR